MDYYENPSHQDQIDYIVFDCIANEKVKIYCKEEWNSYISSLLLSPPLEIKLSPHVLESLWEIDTLLVIQSIKRQTLQMGAMLERLSLSTGKHSAKIAMQINENKLQLEMQAVECYNFLVDELNGSCTKEDEMVIEEDKEEFPSTPSYEQHIVDLGKRDGLDTPMSTQKSKPLVVHEKSKHEEVKRGAYYFLVEESTIFLKTFILPLSCSKPWDPGGRTYKFLSTILLLKPWDPGERSHVESTPWSLYHKLWDPG